MRSHEVVSQVGREFPQCFPSTDPRNTRLLTVSFRAAVFFFWITETTGLSSIKIRWVMAEGMRPTSRDRRQSGLILNSLEEVGFSSVTSESMLGESHI
jgi:hypothetical protein